MNLLLDTHAFLWALSEPDRLGPGARRAMLDPRNAVFVSAITFVEIEIKRSLGKLGAPDGLDAEVESRGFQHLAFRWEHAAVMGRLPRVHADPFDRMLVAQAQVEGMTLVTVDPLVRSYQVAWTW